MASDSAALEQIRVTGTTILTSTTAKEVSHSLAGERYTAFSGALINLLTEFNDSPLALSNLYRLLSAAMARLRLPRPQCSVGDSSGDLILRRWLPPQQPSPEHSLIDNVYIQNASSTVSQPRDSVISGKTETLPPQAGQGVPSRVQDFPAQLRTRSTLMLSRTKRIKPVFWISLYSASALFSGVVLAVGADQIAQGIYKSGIGAAIAALILVSCWLLASVALLIRAVRKLQWRRRHN
jgi:hypothetical protein